MQPLQKPSGDSFSGVVDTSLLVAGSRHNRCIGRVRLEHEGIDHSLASRRRDLSLKDLNDLGSFLP